MAVSRFDLEEAMMALGNTSDDLKLVCEEIRGGRISVKEVASALAGLERINDMRWSKMFRIFEELVGSKNIF